MKPDCKLISRLLTLFIVAVLLMVQPYSHARQFRSLVPIATPDQASSRLPDGARPVERIRQLDRGTVETAMRQVAERWNTPEMSGLLADEFYDQSRLLDNMDFIVPRDATIRLQSIQGIQTLQQYIVPAMDGGREKRVSIVSATARTQIEFERPGSGFVRLPGTNEYILKITTLEPPVR